MTRTNLRREPGEGFAKVLPCVEHWEGQLSYLSQIRRILQIKSLQIKKLILYKYIDNLWSQLSSVELYFLKFHWEITIFSDQKMNIVQVYW